MFGVPWNIIRRKLLKYSKTYKYNNILRINVRSLFTARGCIGLSIILCGLSSVGANISQQFSKDDASAPFRWYREILRHIRLGRYFCLCKIPQFRKMISRKKSEIKSVSSDNNPKWTLKCPLYSIWCEWKFKYETHLHWSLFSKEMHMHRCRQCWLWTTCTHSTSSR